MWAIGAYRLAGLCGGRTFAFYVNPRSRIAEVFWERFSGPAMPFAIIVEHRASQWTVDHETRHVCQWDALGPLFPVVYGIMHLWFGYDDNPLEMDATYWANVTDLERSLPRPP